MKTANAGLRIQDKGGFRGKTGQEMLQAVQRAVEWMSIHAAFSPLWFYFIIVEKYTKIE